MTDDTKPGPDPSNTDPEQLTAPLPPDDEVFSLIREQARMQQYTNAEGEHPAPCDLPAEKTQ